MFKGLMLRFKAFINGFKQGWKEADVISLRDSEGKIGCIHEWEATDSQGYSMQCNFCHEVWNLENDISPEGWTPEPNDSLDYPEPDDIWCQGCKNRVVDAPDDYCLDCRFNAWSDWQKKGG